jgi:hypothetical protein
VLAGGATMGKVTFIYIYKIWHLDSGDRLMYGGLFGDSAVGGWIWRPGPQKLGACRLLIVVPVYQRGHDDVLVCIA